MYIFSWKSLISHAERIHVYKEHSYDKKDFSFFSLNIFKNKITCIIKHFKIKDSWNHNIYKSQNDQGLK